MDSLKNKKEFGFVYKKGIKRYAKNFTLYLLPFYSQVLPSIFKEFSDDTFLLGLSVSKKNGKAVQRNFIKRRVRFLCRSHLEKLKNYALIFVPKEGILELSYKQLEEDFLKCLRGLSQRKKY